jgi:hypothetical protein
MTNLGNDMNSMNHDEFEAALPDLLDGVVDAATRERIDAHVLDCADCAALLADLQQIRADAGALPLLTPSRDLWAGVESRIEAPVMQLPVHVAGGANAEVMPSAVLPVRRTAPGWRLAAAATILVAATAGVTWSVAQRGVSVTDAPSVDTGFAAAMANTQNVRNASRPSLNQTYEGEIATLRKLVDERRSELDSATAAVLEKNLKVIDDAIAESKAALAKSPASAFLLDRLTDAYDSKLRTLRAIAAMPQRGE